MPIATGPSLLLVAPDDRVSDDACRAAWPGATWTRCETVGAAGSFLAAAAFDAVIVDAALPGAVELGSRRDVPVHAVDGGDAESLRRALQVDSTPALVLRDVPAALGRAVHDANNPLTVITGNAQYALEMARAMDVEESLVRSLEDIQEAGRRLEAAMASLADLRRRLAAALESGDGIH